MVAQNLTKSLLYRFSLPMLVLAVSILAYAADRPRDDTKVSIEPRIKPAAEKETDAIPDRRQGRIRIDTTLVQVNVTVTDPLNSFVTGLEKEHFRLFEDKVEQKIAQFSAEDAPLSVG